MGSTFSSPLPRAPLLVTTALLLGLLTALLCESPQAAADSCAGFVKSKRYEKAARCFVTQADRMQHGAQLSPLQRHLKGRKLRNASRIYQMAARSSTRDPGKRAHYLERAVLLLRRYLSEKLCSRASRCRRVLRRAKELDKSISRGRLTVVLASKAAARLVVKGYAFEKRVSGKRWSSKLRPGKYTLIVTFPGHKPVLTGVEVTPGQTQSVRLTPPKRRRAATLAGAGKGGKATSPGAKTPAPPKIAAAAGGSSSSSSKKAGPKPGPSKVKAKAGAGPKGRKVATVAPGGTAPGKTGPGSLEPGPPKSAGPGGIGRPVQPKGGGARKVVPWVIVGGGAALAAAGAVMLGLGQSSAAERDRIYQELKDKTQAATPEQRVVLARDERPAAMTRAQQEHDSAVGRTTTGWILTGAGVAALTTGTILYLLNRARGPRSASATSSGTVGLAAGPGGGVVVLRGAF